MGTLLGACFFQEPVDTIRMLGKRRCFFSSFCIHISAKHLWYDEKDLLIPEECTMHMRIDVGQVLLYIAYNAFRSLESPTGSEGGTTSLYLCTYLELKRYRGCLIIANSTTSMSVCSQHVDSLTSLCA